MGYYQGIGARLVWTSAEVPGSPTGAARPPRADQHDRVRLVALADPDRRRRRGLRVPTCSSWSGATGEQGFVPLCVRDDSSQAAIVIQHSVTTWQAYNRWGGYSLYYGNNGGALSFTHAPAGGTYAEPGADRLVRPALRPRLGIGCCRLRRQRAAGGLPRRAARPRRHLLDRRRPPRPARPAGQPPRPGEPRTRRVLVGPHARRSGVRGRGRPQHGLPRSQRLLPADPVGALAARARPPPGLLQVGGRGPDHRPRRRAGDRQLGRLAGLQTRVRAHREHVPGRRRQRRHGHRRPDRMGAGRHGPERRPTPPQGDARASSTATSPTDRVRPRWTSSPTRSSPTAAATTRT